MYVKTCLKVAAIVLALYGLLFLLTGCGSVPYIEFTHVSSVKDGPLPSWRPEKEETEVNLGGVGLRYDPGDAGGFYLDGQVSFQIGAPKRSELVGTDPHFVGRMGYAFPPLGGKK